MAVATGTIVAAAIAAGASTGGAVIAAKSANNAARTQSAAGERAAATQSASAERVAQTQTEAANRAAEIQAQSAREALQFSRANSQLSLDQYNQQQRRLMPYRNLGNFALGQPFETDYSDLQLPSMGQSGQQASAASLPPPAGMDKLTDPATWMSLVGNDTALAGFVKEGLGPSASGELVNYYVGKIKGQPGANENEQKGSAGYWLQKMRNDPEIGGGGGTVAGGTVARRAPVVANVAPPVSYAPQSPLTPALQPFTYDYQPLNLIGMGRNNV